MLYATPINLNLNLFNDIPNLSGIHLVWSLYTATAMCWCYANQNIICLFATLFLLFGICTKICSTFFFHFLSANRNDLKWMEFISYLSYIRCVPWTLKEFPGTIVLFHYIINSNLNFNYLQFTKHYHCIERRRKIWKRKITHFDTIFGRHIG